MEFLNHLWTIAIVLVISFVTARIVLKIVKKRMSRSKEE